MASFGKKILSAFVEVTEEKKPVAAEEVIQPSTKSDGNKPVTGTVNEKFSNYFTQLFKDANLPGPDYFEFASMIKAMQSIPDERARYAAAFAGLSVQGLNKATLLSTANTYLELLEKDAASFSSTVDAALAEKVKGKQEEVAAKQLRIEQLTREISDLQNQVQLLQLEVKENEEKIAGNSSSYKTNAAAKKAEIEKDIERIQQFI
ncbi:MAG: hypothetical protein U0V75_09640 [Ferruginibacter sp.]